MKKILCFAFAVCIFSFMFTSCEYGLDEFLYRSNTVESRADRLVTLKEEDSPSLTELEKPIGSRSYDVLIITDVHFGGENHGKNGSRRDKDFFNELSLRYTEDTMPKFCICLGDIAEHGYKEEFEDYKNFTQELQKRFGIRTFTVIGNHDLYNSGWDSYKKLIFPYESFYKFRTKEFTWYFVDSASGSLGNTQLELLKNDMQKNENARPKLVFTHIPAYAGGLFYFVMQNSVERNKFISYCAKNNVKALVVGHTHKEITSDIGFPEYNIAGYLEDRAWGILTVNETDGTVTCKSYYLK